jgi:hypothetical protein
MQAVAHARDGLLQQVILLGVDKGPRAKFESSEPTTESTPNEYEQAVPGL